MSLPGANDDAKLDALSGQTYKQQAIWFLNAFWNSFAEKEAENIWTYVHHCNDLDLQDHENGNHLDEMMAHRFLELIHSTLTVREMREGLRAVGITKVKHVPLVNFLIFKFKVDWHKLVNASQGDNQEEVEKAQQMLNDVMKAFEEVQATASAAAKAEVDAINAENDAKRAKAELEEALKALHAEEEAYNKKKADLEKKSQEGGVVSRNKAANELAQLLAEDPLPLRRAKITAEAAVKRAEKTASAAASARASADKSADDASKARQVAEDAANQAEQSRKQAEKDAAAATSARESAQKARAEATAARESAEQARQRATAARESAEKARAEATAARESAEKARAAAAKAREEATASREEANRQREAAEKARQAATASREEAEQARAASERAKEAAENALNEAARQLEAAEAYLNEVKSKPGVSFGAIWWIDRELHEQKKFLPTSRGGIAQ